MRRQRLLKTTFFSPTDLKQIVHCRRDYNRLGFAYHLGFVRLLNRLPNQQPLEVGVWRATEQKTGLRPNRYSSSDAFALLKGQLPDVLPNQRAQKHIGQGTGGIVEVTDLAAASLNQGVYRVVVLPELE